MCGVCERIKETKAGDNPFLVKELETGYVVIGDFQHFKEEMNTDAAKEMAQKRHEYMKDFLEEYYLETGYRYEG